MDLKTGFAAARQGMGSEADAAERRAESDRRTFADRRRSGGLFEVRARRDSGGYDRRQRERRDRREKRLSWFSRWRRED